MILNHKIKKIKDFVLIKNGNIYDPFIKLNKTADILIKNNRIIEISNKIKSDSNYTIIDASDKIVTNGFIDLHAHFREPGYEYKENLKSGSKSAFYGGFTRVCCMPNTNPVIDSPELINFINKKSEELPIYIYPIGSITKKQEGKEMSEIGEMVNAGAIAISDDGIPVKNSQILRMALEYSKKFNIPVINHAEDSFLVNEGIMNEGKNSLKLGLPGNPYISESTMVFRDLSIAEYVSGKIHVPHVSTAKSIEVIKLFKEKGVDITCEITPHHLCLNDEVLLDYNTNSKVAPPIRSKEDQKILLNAVKSGLIDCIATDHAPHSIEDKETDICSAACGMIGFETAFSIVYLTLSKENMSVTSIIDLFSLNPSKIIGIKPNPIKEGSEPEINIIDLNKDWVFSEKHIQSKSKNTPLIGKKLLSKIEYTINKGFISNHLD
jgi:dihydroorotase